MKGRKITTITMSSPCWEKEFLKLLKRGEPFKVTGIETDADWVKVRKLTRKTDGALAESPTEAYFSPSTPPKEPQRARSGQNSPDSQAASKAIRKRPLSAVPKHFLVIEDSADDALLIQRAFGATDSCSAFICRNLSEATAYLQGAGMYGNRRDFPFPNAVICDMHLGFESAVDLLGWINRSKEFQSMPVIILTGTASTRECEVAKYLGALEVLRKPAKYEDLRGMIQDLVGKLCW